MKCKLEFKAFSFIVNSNSLMIDAFEKKHIRSIPVGELIVSTFDAPRTYISHDII